MNSDLYTHYEAVLNAERAERDRLQADLKRISIQIKQKDSVIAALMASIARDNNEARSLTNPLPFQTPVGLATTPENLFAGISVRWALLSLTSDHAPGPLSTPEMAEALAAGGVRSGGQNFVANVSAVVSDMVKNRNELEVVDGGKYRITTHGRDVWQTIKVSRRYRTRSYSWGPPGVPQAG